MSALLQHQLRPKRIAVIRALQLGDLLCAVPALRSLRRAAPKAEITLIGLPWAREFVERFDRYVDNYLEFPGFPGIPETPFDPTTLARFLTTVHLQPFDLAIQLHGSGPFINLFTYLLGASHTAGFYPGDEACPENASFCEWPEVGHEISRLASLIKFLGGPDTGDDLEFPIKPADEEESRRIVTQHELTPGEYVCIHPGGRMLTRRWSLSKFAEVADWLADQGLKIVLTGASFEKELADRLNAYMTRPAVNLAGRTSVGGFAAVLRDARFLFSNDTGVSHIAAALRVPSLVIVLGSDSHRWAPLNRELHQTISHQVECRPCGHYECPIAFPCESGVSAEHVIEVLGRLLEKTGRSCPRQFQRTSQMAIA